MIPVNKAWGRKSIEYITTVISLDIRGYIPLEASEEHPERLPRMTHLKDRWLGDFSPGSHVPSVKVCSPEVLSSSALPGSAYIKAERPLRQLARALGPKVKRCPAHD